MWVISGYRPVVYPEYIKGRMKWRRTWWLTWVNQWKVSTRIDHQAILPVCIMKMNAHLHRHSDDHLSSFRYSVVFPKYSMSSVILTASQYCEDGWQLQIISITAENLANDIDTTVRTYIFESFLIRIGYRYIIVFVKLAARHWGGSPESSQKYENRCNSLKLVFIDFFLCFFALPRLEVQNWLSISVTQKLYLHDFQQTRWQARLPKNVNGKILYPSGILDLIFWTLKLY